MSSEQKSRLLRYGITTGLGLVFTVLHVAGKVDFTNLSNIAAVDLYLALCDGFSVPGMLMILFACMLSISGTGALDGVSYVCSYAFKMLVPGQKKMPERYYEYVERKRGKRPKGFGFLYVVGAAFMAVSFVFMALFYSLY